jgi:hypothetical protein
MMLVENPHYNNHTRRAHGKGNHCGELVDIIGCGHGAAEYKAHATDYAGILLYGGLFTMSTFASVLFVGFAIIAVHFLHVTEGKEEKSTRRYPFLEDANRPMREIYTASWAVEIAEGGDKMADKIASRYGFQNVGKIGGLSGVYHFQLSGLEKANLRTNSPYTVKSDALQSEPCVSHQFSAFGCYKNLTCFTRLGLLINKSSSQDLQSPTWFLQILSFKISGIC